MVYLCEGDLFEVDVLARVNAVNCVGVMGNGIALQFKKRYPEMFGAYRERCQRNEVEIGKLDIHICDNGDCVYLINLSTKRHWRYNSTKEDVQAGLDALLLWADEKSRHLSIPVTIAMPAVGCGLGGLPFEWLREEVLQRFQAHQNVKMYLFAPGKLMNSPKRKRRNV